MKTATRAKTMGKRLSSTPTALGQVRVTGGQAGHARLGHVTALAVMIPETANLPSSIKASVIAAGGAGTMRPRGGAERA